MSPPRSGEPTAGIGGQKPHRRGEYSAANPTSLPQAILSPEIRTGRVEGNSGPNGLRSFPNGEGAGSDGESKGKVGEALRNFAAHLGASLSLQEQRLLEGTSEVERVPHVSRVLVARSEKGKSVKFIDEPDDTGELQPRVLDVPGLCEGRDNQ